MCSAISDAAGNSNLSVTKSTNSQSGKAAGDFSEFFTLITALQTDTDGQDLSTSDLLPIGSETDLLHSVSDFNYSSIVLPKDFNEVATVSSLENSEPQLPTANALAMLTHSANQNDYINDVTTDLQKASEKETELSNLLSNLKQVFDFVETEINETGLVGRNSDQSLAATNTNSLLDPQSKEFIVENLQSKLNVLENTIVQREDYQLVNVKIDESSFKTSHEDSNRTVNKLFIGSGNNTAAAILEINISNDDVAKISLFDLDHQFGKENTANIAVDTKILDAEEKQISIRLPHEVPSIMVLSVTRHTDAEHPTRNLNISVLNGLNVESDTKLQPNFVLGSDDFIQGDLVFKELPSLLKVMGPVSQLHDTFEIGLDGEFQLDQIKTINAQLRNFLDILDTREVASRGLEQLKGNLNKDISLLQNEALLRLAVKRAAKRVISSGEQSIKSKPLFLSTVSVLSWRENDSTKAAQLDGKNILARTFKGNYETSTAVFNSMNLDSELRHVQSTTAENKIDAKPVFNTNFEFVKLTTDLRFTPTNTAPLTASAPNQLSLFDAQFTSRLAAISIEQALTSQDAVELNLEPKSFGKLTVNASIDASGLDVKLHADNHATLAILRGSEALLNTITEQNGLKLAGYSVDLGGGASDNSGSNGQNQKNANEIASGNLGDHKSENDTSSDKQNDEYTLNLIA
jgi:hypothetical protein